ncbi:MAG: hypothetical protein ACK5M7_19880 [Draconibacterium sp.]
MKITNLLARGLFVIGVVSLFFGCGTDKKISDDLMITYPFNHSVFPRDIIAPIFRWQCNTENIDHWKISVSNEGAEMFTDETIENFWRPDNTEWGKIVALSGANIQVTIQGIRNKPVCSAQVTFDVSKDIVEAPVFFRAVPLPFKFARENLKRVRWHLGSVSAESKPHVMLENIPVCANCHSFTPQGNNIGNL